MKRKLTTLLLMLLAVATASAADNNQRLWYEHPAQRWVDGLPLGNGELMAVTLGDPYEETIQLNEQTLWSGGKMDRENPEGYKYLDQVRKLLFEGKYIEGEKLAVDKLVGTLPPTGLNCYQTLGNVLLSQQYDAPRARVSGYEHELDLERAVASVSYTVGGVEYRRETFISAVDKMLYMRLSADKPASISLNIGFERDGATIRVDDEQRLVASGIAKSVKDPEWGTISYQMSLEPRAKGGKTTTTDQSIIITKADEVLIRLVAATDYLKIDPAERCLQLLAATAGDSFVEVQERHIAEYQGYYKRLSIDLTDKYTMITKVNPFHGTISPEKLPTDRRLASLRMESWSDPNILALYLQYGRYIMISCSRPGTLAINLWGKWINSYNPSYDGDYHTNINIPMNYWPAEITNLSECHQPYFDLIDSLRPNGRISARNSYNCGGFVSHWATDPWYYTTLVGGPAYGIWTLTAPWACHQMWEHYLYTMDEEYLRDKIYPIMRECMEFYFDYLVEDPETGYLVSGPATSPENRYVTEDGSTASITMGPTADMQVLKNFIGDYIEACKVLDVDAKYRKRAEKIKSRLLPFPIGEDGRMQEWARPLEEKDMGHKHMSHLYGVCEGDVISPSKTPAEASALLRSLEVRDSLGMYASKAFKAITAWGASGFARLYQGERTYETLKYIIGECSMDNLMAYSNQGIIREMYETDANLGATMVVAELFMQSYEGFIHLLPALPEAIPCGKISGFRARGGFEVSLEWDRGAIVTASILSLKGERCSVMYRGELLEFETTAGESYALAPTADGRLELVQ